MAQNQEATQSDQTLNILISGGDSSAGLATVREATKLGHTVYAQAEKGSFGANRIRMAGGIPVYPELTRESSWRSAILFAKADVIINCAPQYFYGLPHHRIDYAAEAGQIEAGTEAIVAAAGKSGIKRLVHLSTALLYGATHGAATEDAHIHRGNALLNAAADAEELIFDGGIPGYVVRAGVIYGGHHDAMAAISQSLRHGKGLPKGPGTVSWVHDADLGAALALLAQLEVESELTANVINVADDEPMTYDAFVNQFGTLYGVGEPGTISDFFTPLYTNPIQQELLSQTTLIDNGKAKELLGWKPAVTSKTDGIERSMLIWRAESATEQETVTA